MFRRVVCLRGSSCGEGGKDGGKVEVWLFKFGEGGRKGIVEDGLR